MKISVIVTAYNHEKFIIQCLNGILQQERRGFDLEVILGDDCSTDHTFQIMQDHQQRLPGIFKILSTEHNLGVMKNIKRCLDACSGDFIAFCEGDDYWTDCHKLEKQFEFMEGHPDYSLCFNAIMFYEEYYNQYRAYSEQMHFDDDTLSVGDLIKCNYIGNMSCCFYRAEVIKRIPVEIFELPISDCMLNMLCCRYGKIGFIRDWMSVYRIHPHGAWSGISNQEKHDVMLKRLEIYRRYFPEYGTQIGELQQSVERRYGRKPNLIKKIIHLSLRAFRHPLKTYQTLKAFIQNAG
jgi:glycosyltransferase involved in cell wall biosynthesis